MKFDAQLILEELKIGIEVYNTNGQLLKRNSHAHELLLPAITDVSEILNANLFKHPFLPDYFIDDVKEGKRTDVIVSYPCDQNKLAEDYSISEENEYSMLTGFTKLKKTVCPKREKPTSRITETLFHKQKHLKEKDEIGEMSYNYTFASFQSKSFNNRDASVRTVALEEKNGAIHKFLLYKYHPVKKDGEDSIILTIEDITNKYDAFKLLQEQMHSLSFAIAANDIAAWDYDVKRRVFCSIVGQPVANKPTTYEDLVKIVHPDDADLFFEVMRMIISRKKESAHLIVRVKQGDEYVAYENRFGPLYDEDGKVTHVFGSQVKVRTTAAIDEALDEKNREIQKMLLINNLILNHTNVGLVFLNKKLIVNWENISDNHENLQFLDFKVGKEYALPKAVNWTEKDRFFDDCRKHRTVIQKDVLFTNEKVLHITIIPVLEYSNELHGFVLTIDDVTDVNKRLRYQEALNNCSAILLKQEEKSVNLALKELLKGTRASRVYIYENYTGADGDLYLDYAYECCAEGVSSHLSARKDKKISYVKEGYVRWKKELEQNRVIYGAVSDFPELESKRLKHQGINYLLVAPLFVSDKWIGFLGIDYCYEITLSNRDIELQIVSSRFFSSYYTTFQYRSNLEKTNNELQETLQAKEKLMMILSHDLKAPVNSILGFSDLLLNKKENSLTDIERVEYLKVVNRSALEMEKQINNMMLWIQSLQQKFSMNRSWNNLYVIANSCLNMVSSTAFQKEIKLINRVPKDFPVYADQEMITIILRNLIANAIKFTYNRGNIILDATIKENYVIISVQDNGIGMSQQQINSIFINTISTKGTNGEIGTGLGLPICKEFVKLHQGEIWVDSTLGEGSAFYFSILNIE